MASNSVSLNLGPFGLLPVLVFIVFLYLKLAGVGVVATWPWLWVCSPLWIGLAVGLGLIVFFLGFVFIVAILKVLS